MIDLGDPMRSAVVVDHLTGRQVMVRDPEPGHPAMVPTFLARETSVRVLAGRVLLHVLEADGMRFTAPPSWVSSCPENVVSLPRGPASR